MKCSFTYVTSFPPSNILHNFLPNSIHCLDLQQFPSLAKEVVVHDGGKESDSKKPEILDLKSNETNFLLLFKFNFLVFPH